jgi:ribose 5-phosphate isomerase RpiB
LNEIVDKFLETKFEGGRHKRRVDIITDYEGKSHV